MGRTSGRDFDITSIVSSVGRRVDPPAHESLCSLLLRHPNLAVFDCFTVLAGVFENFDKAFEDIDNAGACLLLFSFVLFQQAMRIRRNWSKHQLEMFS